MNTVKFNPDELWFMHIDGGSLPNSDVPERVGVSVLPDNKVRLGFPNTYRTHIHEVSGFTVRDVEINVLEKYNIVSSIVFNFDASDDDETYESNINAHVGFIINFLMQYADRELLTKNIKKTLSVLSARSVALLLYKNIDAVCHAIMDAVPNINAAASNLGRELRQYDWLTAVEVGVDIGGKQTIMVYADSLVDSIASKIPNSWEGYPVLARRMKNEFKLLMES